MGWGFGWLTPSPRAYFVALVADMSTARGSRHAVFIIAVWTVVCGLGCGRTCDDVLSLRESLNLYDAAAATLSRYPARPLPIGLCLARFITGPVMTSVLANEVSVPFFTIRHGEAVDSPHQLRAMDSAVLNSGEGMTRAFTFVRAEDMMHKAVKHGLPHT